MSYELTIKKREDVLWVKATGTRSLQTVLAMSEDIFTACIEQNTTKVLVDVRALEGRLETMEAYQIPDKHFPKMRDRSVITRAAIVDLEEFRNIYKFFENVAVNRGFALRVFSDLDEALEWLNE
jgi:hypothetical protein